MNAATKTWFLVDTVKDTFHVHADGCNMLRTKGRALGRYRVRQVEEGDIEAVQADGFRVLICKCTK